MASSDEPLTTSPPSTPSAPSAWRGRAVTRSLERSRARAELRSEQFVETALELIEETGDSEFTVQEITDRMRVSTKTFYQYFSGKDDLLVALFEEAQRERSRNLREAVAAASDPLARLRAFVIGSQGPATNPGVARLLVKQYFRLQLTHPEDLRATFQGNTAYLRDLIADAAAVGAVRSTDHDRAAALVLQLITTAIQANILGSPLVDPPSTPEEVWEFCRVGLDVADARGAN